MLGADAAVLAAWLQGDSERPVAFDCPIDVQGLASPSDVDSVWQLRVRRFVLYAIGEVIVCL